MTGQPHLTADDRAVWAGWRRVAAIHAHTRQFARRVDAARRVIGEALHQGGPEAWCGMWSGGKDSTVLVHLLAAEGAHVAVASEKDDLDFPGEREYVERLAAAWRVRLDVLVPPISPRQWIAEHAHELRAADDLHSRAAALSKACFYDVVEAYTAPYDGVLLGLRQAESEGRRLNRATRGLLYRKAPTAHHPAGQLVATPLGDWEGIDVYAYAEARGLDLLPVYQCVAFMHRREPWRVRKSWWLPGCAGRHGGVAWLRRYWPGLYAQLVAWMPDAQGLA